MAGPLVWTWSECQEALVPGQLPHLPHPSSLQQGCILTWRLGHVLCCWGAQLESWFHKKVEPWGRESTSCDSLYRNHVPLLLFCGLIVDLPLYRWRGMLKCSLSGPFLSL